MHVGQKIGLPGQRARPGLVSNWVSSTGAFQENTSVGSQTRPSGKRSSPATLRHVRKLESNIPNPAVQRTGASRFAQRRIQRHRRLAPVADLCVGLLGTLEIIYE